MLNVLKAFKPIKIPLNKNERYLINEDGEVYDSKKDKLLNHHIDRKGYHKVSLYGKSKSVHRLVALTFIENPFIDPEKFTVNHKNGDKNNNTVANLSWNTNKQNLRHAYRNGLNGKNKGGEKAYQTLYSEDQVHNVCRLLSDYPEMSLKEISLRTGVPRDNILHILNYKSWIEIFSNYDFIPNMNIDKYFDLIVNMVKYIHKGLYCNEILEKLNIPIKNGNTSERKVFNFCKYKVIPKLEECGYYDMIFPKKKLLYEVVLSFKHKSRK